MINVRRNCRPYHRGDTLLEQRMHSLYTSCIYCLQVGYIRIVINTKCNQLKQWLIQRPADVTPRSKVTGHRPLQFTTHNSFHIIRYTLSHDLHARWRPTKSHLTWKLSPLHSRDWPMYQFHGLLTTNGTLILPGGPIKRGPSFQQLVTLDKLVRSKPPLANFNIILFLIGIRHFSY